MGTTGAHVTLINSRGHKSENTLLWWEGNSSLWKWAYSMYKRNISWPLWAGDLHINKAVGWIGWLHLKRFFFLYTYINIKSNNKYRHLLILQEEFPQWPQFEKKQKCDELMTTQCHRMSHRPSAEGSQFQNRVRSDTEIDLFSHTQTWQSVTWQNDQL